jgi:hypothetical protein
MEHLVAPGRRQFVTPPLGGPAELLQWPDRYLVPLLSKPGCDYAHPAALMWVKATFSYLIRHPSRFSRELESGERPKPFLE